MSSPSAMDQEDHFRAPKIERKRPEDCIRIMLATDCHIGFAERDPVRGQDSINTFEEVLQQAVKHDVDFILLAGDLFHENRPSRDSLYRTMALLREYTLGEKPISVELLSDPLDGKAATFSFPAINYEDPNLNIAIPVFSIHGNHDDPQGTGSDGALCALDVLSVAGLVNYMGKIDLPSNDEQALQTGIALRPVLLQKGQTRLAMYGVGNVKDQRMHYELRSNRVRMFTPMDKEEWFNILLLHQNRVKRGSAESVPEGMFDDCIDLIVWGHEHDCRILPEPVTDKPYFISQPGSTVATSLADGESSTKHCALLEVQGKRFEITPIVLRTVRPFKLEEVILTQVAEEEGLDLTDKIEINKYLKHRINELIIQADEEFTERNADADNPPAPMLPLIRLKVDTTGVAEMSNPIRFGQEFAGKVANPRDVLTFFRSKRPTAKKVQMDNPALSIDDPELSISEKLSRVRVQTLVKEFLVAQEVQLLGENGMADAIELFVDKDDTHSIEKYVNSSLKVMQKELPKNDEMDDEELQDLLANAKNKYEKEYEVDKSMFMKHAKTGKRKDKATDESEVDSMLLDDDDVPPSRTKKSTPAPRAARAKAGPRTAKAKAAPKARGKKVPTGEDEDEEGDEDEIIQFDDDEAEEERPKPKKSRATASGPAPRKAPAKPATKKSTQSSLSFVPSSRGSRATTSKKKTIEVSDSD